MKSHDEIVFDAIVSLNEQKLDRSASHASAKIAAHGIHPGGHLRLDRHVTQVQGLPGRGYCRVYARGRKEAVDVTRALVRRKTVGAAFWK